MKFQPAIKIALGVILIGILLFLILNSQDKNKENEELSDYANTSDIPSTNFSFDSLPSDDISEEDLIPDMNVSCEDLIPGKIFLKDREFESPQLLYTLSTFKNDLHLKWGNCTYNTDIGQKITGFECEGVYIEINRTSTEGIILEDYRVSYQLFFDTDECNTTYVEKVRGYDCGILNYSCYWVYCDNKGC
jgi:hypothetical protein